MTFYTDLMADAKAYIASAFGVDVDIVADEHTRDFIDKLYPGGWDTYERNFRRFHVATEVKTEEWSPIKKKSMVERWCNIRLSEYDEILLFEVSDEEMKFVVSRAIVDRRSRRDVIGQRRIQLYVFHRNPTNPKFWSRPDYIETEVDAEEAHVRWGVIHTPERDEAIREQVETCYRPGSAKSPMKGWVARLEVSWKEAHADEDFPINHA